MIPIPLVIFNGTSLLQQFRTHRLRPNWIPFLNEMKGLAHLSFHCPLPNGTDEPIYGYTHVILRLLMMIFLSIIKLHL
jgi:hypothetical protein